MVRYGARLDFLSIRICEQVRKVRMTSIVLGAWVIFVLGTAGVVVRAIGTLSELKFQRDAVAGVVGQAALDFAIILGVFLVVMLLIRSATRQ